MNRTATLLSVAALGFVASAATTVRWSTSMTDIGGIPMSGGWTMSPMWMPMCGDSRAGAFVMFVGMWTVMMVAMMLPSLVAQLWRHRSSPVHLIGVAAFAYFVVWTLIGMAAYPAGTLLAALQAQVPGIANSTPLAAGAAILILGLLQFTASKARRLACCRGDFRSRAFASCSEAWRHGLRLGMRCVVCCANLMGVLIALGMMSVAPMAFVTAAITLERVAPDSERVARMIGMLVVGTGVWLIVDAAN